LKNSHLFLLLVIAALAGGLTIPKFLTWLSPALLQIEGDARVGADAPFSVTVRANKPVLLTVSYQDQEVEQETAELQVSLLAAEGSATVQVLAVDSRGQETRGELQVEGVPPVVPLVSLPTELYPGDPIGIEATWDQSAPARISEVLVSVNGEQVRHFETAGGIMALARIPLEETGGNWPLQVTLIDEFGREAGTSQPLWIREWPSPVTELSLPDSVLALMTEENEQLEAEMFAAALARANPEPLWSEPFLIPSEGWHSSAFGAPRRYYPGGPVSHHTGTDLASLTGTPIYATNHGVVLVAGFYPLKGGLVVLDHGAGLTSLYMHQSEIHVTAGQKVERGDLLGEVGSTGISTGPHLHWEMRLDGEPTNSLLWADRLIPGDYRKE
jgi:hypothetical protein